MTAKASLREKIVPPGLKKTMVSLLLKKPLKHDVTVVFFLFPGIDQSVLVGREKYSPKVLLCRMPQNSTLFPLLFNIYMKGENC